MCHFDLRVLHIHFLRRQVLTYDKDLGILASMHTVKSVWEETERLLCADFKSIANITFYMKLK